jgi:hypothetical protein
MMEYTWEYTVVHTQREKHTHTESELRAKPSDVIVERFQTSLCA